MDYEVYKPRHVRDKQIYHINMLKAWREPEGWMLTPEGVQEELGPEMVERDEGEKNGRTDTVGWCSDM